MITHHPDPVTLVSYAAGTLPEPLAAVIASHIWLCAECRHQALNLEALGGALLMDAPARPGPTLVAPAHRDARVLGAPQVHRAPDERLPAPIAATYGLSFASIPWQWLGPGIWHYRLPLSEGVSGDLRLLKISAGRAMPDHGHGGSELTLVLDGTYADETGKYGVGDIQDVDEAVEHTPIADPVTGCICLIASEKPARFKGWIGRLLQPFTGM
jgi:putative transcriptional regulator